MPKSVLDPPRSKRSVGKDEEKVDIEDKVTGRATYGSDLQSDDYLHAAVVRSTQSHARIKSINAEQARSVDGVQSIVMREDLIGNYDDRVRFYGDVIAAVAADDPETAKEAANLVKADLESLDAVYDPHKSLSSDTPQLHPNNPEFGQHGRHEFDNDNDSFEENVDDYHSLTVGDVETGFSEADVILEEEYTTPRVSPCNLDTHCCVAQWDDDHLIIEETLGAPGRSKDELADFMGMDGEDIEVLLPDTISSSFGARSLPQITLEPVAATLAKETQSPVKLWFGREDEFIATDHRHQTHYTLKMGITAEGDITALDIDVVADTGAYPNGVGHIVLSNGQSRPLDIYKIPHYDFEGVSVYTNNLIAGEFRGIGSTQLGYALDSHMDELALKAGLDPTEFRKRNFVKEGFKRPHTGRPIESCGLLECVDRGRERFDELSAGPSEDPDRVRGWGIGAGTHTTGLGAVETDRNETDLRLNPDGTVTAEVDALDHGQGSGTVMTQIIAEELGLPLDKIDVNHYRSTKDHDEYLGSVASRTTYITGAALKDALENLKSELSRRAAESLTVVAQEIKFEDGIIKVGSDSIDYAEIIDEPLDITGYSESPLTPAAYGVHFAEVEVDTATGEVNVLTYVAAQDVGYAINPKMVEGQLEGGISQGIEFSLIADLKLNQGIPMNANLADFSVASPFEMPDTLACEIIESNEESGPYGAKGIGTPSMPPIAPAIANAIRDATGERFTHAPFESEQIAKRTAMKATDGGE